MRHIGDNRNFSPLVCNSYEESLQRAPRKEIFMQVLIIYFVAFIVVVALVFVLDILLRGRRKKF
jgi:hypothetical protein